MYPTPLTPPKRPRRNRRRPLFAVIFTLLIAAAYCCLVISRPFAELNPNRISSNLTITTPSSTLPWPTYGQGALGLSSGEIIATHGTQTAVPIASAAKVVTALLVLQRHPLSSDASGPSITMTTNDVALYNEYVLNGGSVTPVHSGQKLSERELLQALLLPSANNIADTLAIWSYGSVNAYLTAANSYLQKNGLTTTKVAGDASGYLPDSTSTASDLVRLGALALKNQAIAEIVGQKTAVISGIGTVHNYNSLLGSDGIVGIKTGNNDQNGGVFIGASQQTIRGQSVTLISALSGAPSLNTVLRDSRTLLVAAESTVADTNIVHKDAVMGTYLQANGQVLQAVAANDVHTTVLRGTDVKATVSLDSISYNAKAGDKVGTIHVPATRFAGAESNAVVLKQAPTKPDLFYRLTHP